MITKGQEDYNSQVWTDFNYMSFVGFRTALFGDVGYRVQINSPNWSQIVIRPGIQFNKSSTWNFTGGVGCFHKFIDNTSFDNEIRPFQGVKTNMPFFKRFHFQNYFRIEQRFFIDNNVPISLRLRNQFKVSLILFNKGGQQLSIPFSGEWFFDSASEDVETLSQARQRYFTGIDYRSKNWRLTGLFNFQGQRESFLSSLNRTDVMYRIRFYYYFKFSSSFSKSNQ